MIPIDLFPFWRTACTAKTVVVKSTYVPVCTGYVLRHDK